MSAPRQQQFSRHLSKITSKTSLLGNDSIYKIVDLIRSNGHTARIVGGAVRDSLLGISCKDIDIATDMLPTDILSLFNKQGYKAIATGLDFGTVTVVVDDNSYEITTLRRDIATDGRHAKVVYTDDYEEDAARRDFTINALSYDLIEERLYDYFDGLNDLDNRRVRFIGQPDNRIQEDYLRILRFFRFSSYYADNLDNEGLDACLRNASHITKLSKERIKAEIDRLIINPNSIDVLAIILDHDIWKYIFGFKEFDIKLLNRVWNIANNIGEAPLDSTLYGLITLQDKPSIRQLTDLKFSKNQAKFINDLHKLAESILVKTLDEIQVTLTKKWLEEEHWQQYFLFYIALSDKDSCEVIKRLYRKLENYGDKPTFPVQSQSLIKLGIEGKELGVMLEKLQHVWIESDFSLTQQQLIEKSNK